jgi:hypothetical protein
VLKAEPEGRSVLTRYPKGSVLTLSSRTGR